MLLILFRSDTRPQNLIFEEGFTTREKPSITLTPTSPFESDRQKSIALSAKFEAVPFFPSESKETESQIYVVAVDDSQGPAHYLDLHSRSLSMDDKDDLAYRLPFQEFVKEKNVICVPAEHVLCSFKIKRNLINTYCEAEGKATPDCDSFVIESEAISNPKAAATLKNNPNLQKSLTKIINEYNAKVGQEIDVPEPKPKLGKETYKKILLRNAFFVMNRLETLNNYTPEHSVFATVQPESTQAFFKKAALQSSSGLFFSSEEHICKQNSLFYKAVESGFFDKRIEQEEKSINAFRNNAAEAGMPKIASTNPVQNQKNQQQNSETDSDSECEETLQLGRKYSEY